MILLEKILHFILFKNRRKNILLKDTLQIFATKIIFIVFNFCKMLQTNYTEEKKNIFFKKFCMDLTCDKILKVINSCVWGWNI